MCLPQSLLAGEVAVRLSLESVWLTVAVRWVPVVTDPSSLPCESGYHGSQHTDSPRGPQASGPGPQAKCNPHSGLPDSWGLCRASCKDSLCSTKRESTSRSLSSSQTHCLHTSVFPGRNTLSSFPQNRRSSWLIFCFFVPEKYFAPIGKAMWEPGLWAGGYTYVVQAGLSQRGRQ